MAMIVAAHSAAAHVDLDIGLLPTRHLIRQLSQWAFDQRSSCTGQAAWHESNHVAREGWMAAGHAPITLGSSRSRCADVDGLLVTWVRFPPLAKLPLHTHERATVAVILTGSFDGLMRHSSHPCPASTFLTEPPGEP